MSVIFIISLTIILIFLFFLSFWINNYRLGDFIRQSAEFKYLPLRYIYRKFQNRKSIVYKYGLGKKNNYQKIQRICDSQLVKKIEKNRAVIHLRVGEVIDNNIKTVHELFHKVHLVNKKKIKDPELEVNGTLSYLGTRPKNPLGYVKNIFYYQEIAYKLKKLGVSKIIIIAGGLGNIGKKSREYVNLVKSFLEDKSFDVEVRINTDADSDLCIMGNSRIFIPSGGGYSKIISEVVRINGGVVIGKHS